MYVEWCKAIPEDRLESVFREAMESSPEFMPTGAKLSQVWKDRQTKSDALAGEQEWEEILQHVLRYGAVCYRSDEKLDLSARAEYSLRQIGGSDWRQALAFADDDRLHWLRKNFLENYNRHAETGGLLAPSREEARSLLNKIMEYRKKLTEGEDAK